ncbi:MAG: Dyp-type peroxidase [Acidimicrobiales bacterium]
MRELSAADKRDIQGFIFSGYGHLNVGTYLFLEITDAPRGREFLGQLTPSITTAEDWRKRPDGTKEKPPSTLNVAISYDGMAALGLSDDALETFSREFIMGMAARAPVVGDAGPSAPAHWEIGGPDNPSLHVLVILYAIDESTRDDRVAWLRDLARRSDGGVVETGEQGGIRYTNREPFGFHDGVGQPGVEGIDGEPGANVVRLGEFVLGHTNQYQLLPPTVGVPVAEDPLNVLPPFPTLPGYKDLGRNGTYAVYRKLAQDVPAFWRFAEENGAAPPGGSQEERRHAVVQFASRMVGRWPSGAPLVLSPDRDDHRFADTDAFLYTRADPHAFACPVGAHIRRSNPRDAILGDSVEDSLLTSNRHRIIRRSLIFGPPLVTEATLAAGRAPLGLEDDGQERGIQFIAINTNIANQFEFIQQTWTNNTKFNGLLNDRDPLIGDNTDPTWLTLPGRPVRRRVSGVPNFVTNRGGGYLFMPSITAMRFLASSRAAPVAAV